jgi:hypothetical protein
MPSRPEGIEERAFRERDDIQVRCPSKSMSALFAALHQVVYQVQEVAA